MEPTRQRTMKNALPLTHKNGINFLDLSNNSCDAELSLYGGQLLSWQPKGQHPVLWMSETARLDGSGAIRGGIPICWPWFGVVDGKGRHGLVRNRVWQLDAYSRQTDITTVQLSIELDDTVNPWPHPNRLEMQLSIGRELHQTLSMRNDTDEALSVTCALHSYFAVSAPSNVSIAKLAGKTYYDHIRVVHGLTDTGDEPYVGPIDRIYESGASVTFIDNGWKRKLEIEKSGSEQWVLWNPGSEANTIADIHSQGQDGFICLEAAQTAPRTIHPGEEYRLSQSLRVAPI